MYGIINKSLREMVIDHYGEVMWQQIMTLSGVPDDSFLSLKSYDDEVTYALASTTADVLGIDLGTALHAFGHHWLKSSMSNEYAVLMNSTGDNLVEFLNNLNSMHDRISSTFLDYRPPEFKIIEQSAEGVVVDYLSFRLGLSPFVEGLLEALAEHFAQPMEMVSIEAMPVASGTHMRYSINLG